LIGAPNVRIIYDKKKTAIVSARRNTEQPAPRHSKSFVTILSPCVLIVWLLKLEILIMLQSKAFDFARRATLCAAVATLFSACATIEKPVSVAETIAKTPSLSTLNGLIVSAGLTSALQGTGPFTVFAPNNEAFKAVKPAAMDDLAKHPEKLKDLLTYHVVPALALAKDVKNSNVKALNGDPLALSKAGDFVTVENAAVVQADVMASNGVIHIVDAVMTPVKK
jgi:uncharacterized surface protein with fasciclin (FAS1) repeats